MDLPAIRFTLREYQQFVLNENPVLAALAELLLLQAKQDDRFNIDCWEATAAGWELQIIRAFDLAVPNESMDYVKLTTAISDVLEMVRQKDSLN